MCGCSGGGGVVSVLLLQEPYIGNTGRLALGHRIIQHSSPTGTKPVKSAIVILDPTIEITVNQEMVTENIVCVVVLFGTTRVGLASLYCEGTDPVENYLLQLQRFIPRLGTGGVTVTGDVNAHSPWWGSGIEDPQGEAVNDFLAMHDLHVLNTGAAPIFSVYRGGVHCASFVDITACSGGILHQLQEWRVDERLVTLSDHRAVRFVLRTDREPQTWTGASTRKFNTRKAD